MESQELKMIEESIENNPELKALWEEHVILSKQVAKLESKQARTPSAELELKEFKKKKLEIKTLLQEKIDAQKA